ncbi:hypothetical protein ACFX1W_028730 [Malus domestica]
MSWRDSYREWRRESSWEGSTFWRTVSSPSNDHSCDNISMYKSLIVSLATDLLSCLQTCRLAVAAAIYSTQ